MESILLKNGYIYDEAKGIWNRQDFDGIAYSDGDDVENRIFEIIKNTNDLSILSDELKPHCTDWPFTYHLSSSRANILRPFEYNLTGDILEIGAGCGAITRYLGECGANVLALEGSPRRAMIARSRTRDQENVTVISEKFEDFSIDQKFDVITLIGVLEYASLFTSSESPAIAMLERVKSFLKPGGTLIIAIENQLGLKYFAGAPEDHIGQAMYGLEGRYKKTGPKTFGRSLLTNMIKVVGFPTVNVLAPFPDYKLPTSIVSENGFETLNFDAAAFAWQSVKKDRQLPAILSFSPEKVWPTVVQNQLGLDLSNSLLFVASNSEESILKSDFLAWHFSTDRKESLCKSAHFVNKQHGVIDVDYTRLSRLDKRDCKSDLIEFVLPKKDDYVFGDVFILELIQVISNDGWSNEDVGLFIKKYINFIQFIANEKNIKLTIDGPLVSLPGEFFDLIPQNIIIDRNGSPHFIDLEWKFLGVLELGYLIFRALLPLGSNFLTRIARHADMQLLTPIGLIKVAFESLEWDLTADMIEKYIDIEASIQSYISTRSLHGDDYIKWLNRPFETKSMESLIADSHSHIKHQDHLLAEKDSRIIEQDHLLAEKDSRIIEQDHLLAEKDSRIIEQDHLLTEKDLLIERIFSSTSWKLTLPIRLVGKYIFNVKNNELGVSKIKSKKNSEIIEIKNKREELPPNFDPLLYLKLNPDLSEAGTDPVWHYINHGRLEGRVFESAEIIYSNKNHFRANLETILIVSHEASRTGAPILSYNLSCRLQENYNVVNLLLNTGDLIDSFICKSHALLAITTNLRGNLLYVNSSVSALCKAFDFKFAIVNSIESRHVLPILSQCGIPTVSLIHEFASYTRPERAFSDAFFWSDEVVFSAKTTLDDAISHCPEFADKSSKILSQGQCVVPSSNLTEAQVQEEALRIRNLVRPDGSDDQFIILGAGYVQLRKGVDLFIECAAKVINSPGGENCRFVWIGKGYDPVNDTGYSVYLADQIRRSNLENHISFINETCAIEAAYAEANLFLLSSRLDPMPNVAIDALVAGLPVLCFDRTTGIAEFLQDIGLSDKCVAGYLDSDSMAKNILNLVSNKSLYDSVASQCRLAAIDHFNMKRYVDQLEKLGLDAIDRKRQKKLDTQVILDSKLFCPSFSNHPNAIKKPIEASVDDYVHCWATGVGRRKPLPGFHPGIYLEKHGIVTAGSDPFADYIRAGRPDGPWNCQVISEARSANNSLPTNDSVVLHLHVYYLDLLPEIISRLSINKVCPDLLVSISDISHREVVLRHLAEYRGNVIDIKITPNLGRDIGPFFTGFKNEILSGYEYVGHIHTKKTADIKDPLMVQAWNSFLLNNLLGGKSAAMADCILSRMRSDVSLGIVFPDDPNVIGWSKNKPFAEKLASNLAIADLPKNFNFPVGSMFWARVDAIKSLFDLNMDWSDYPKEPLPYDGTVLHAIERMLALVATSNGYKVATTNVVGISR